MTMPTKPPADIHCLSCGHRFGTSTEYVLTLDYHGTKILARITRPITLTCPTCNRERKWRPFDRKPQNGVAPNPDTR
jgi:hypothetical protein